MSYQSKADLPETLQTALPDEAQTVYINAYNEAEAMMARNEQASTGGLPTASAAHAVAWEAVEEQFEQNEKDGTWYRKGEGGQSLDTEITGGLLDRIKNLF
jgi:cation transport regulator ChaB